MKPVRISASARGFRGTAVFLCAAAVVAVLVAFVPHSARVPVPLYRALNGTLKMNWFFSRAYAAPLSTARAYGIATRPVDAAAGEFFTTSVYVRPTGAPGGRACLAIVAAVDRASMAPVQANRECRRLSAGWNKLLPLTLGSDKPEFVYAQLLVRGNAGGFEARPLVVVPGS